VILLLVVVVGVVMLQRASANSPASKPGQEEFATSRDRALLAPLKTAISASATERAVLRKTHDDVETPRKRPI